MVDDVEKKEESAMDTATEPNYQLEVYELPGKKRSMTEEKMAQMPTNQ